MTRQRRTWLQCWCLKWCCQATICVRSVTLQTACGSYNQVQYLQTQCVWPCNFVCIFSAVTDRLLARAGNSAPTGGWSSLTSSTGALAYLT